MMRLGTVSFLATAALLIPAGFNPLGADAPDEPAAARPPAEILAIGLTNVEVSLDRRTVAAGERVHVSLVASSETSRDVEVTVAFEDGSKEDIPGDAPELPAVGATVDGKTVESGRRSVRTPPESVE